VACRVDVQCNSECRMFITTINYVKIRAEPASNSANQQDAQKAIKFMYIAQQL